MSASVRFAVIAVVAALAVGIGVAAAGFLVSQRSAGVGGGAGYVPADAPFFLELRLQPSDEQDAGLRELLGHFPAIEGIDLGRPLYGQLGEALDEMLVAAEADVTWSGDIASWFDGHLAMAITDIPLDALREVPTDSSAEPPVPPVVLLLGVTDRAAAEGAIERVLAAAGEAAPAFTETEVFGITIRSAADEGAYALTDDQLVFASDADGVRAALEAHEAGTGTLSEMAAITRLTDELPDDWLAFMTYDMTDLLAASVAEAGAESTEMAAALGSLLEHQSLRGAMALSAQGDRLLFDMATDPPSGPFAPENAERGLAEEVPGDALYYSEAGNIAQALAAFIQATKDAAAAVPEGQEQVDTAEAALGASLEDVVSWIDDGAVVIGAEDGEAYGGLLLVPNDVDAARRRLSQLGSFAALGGLDASSGISVDEAEVAGVMVTTIRWEDPSAGEETMLPAPPAIVIEYAVTDDRAIIGFGDRFVRRALDLDADDSLAAQPRFSDAVGELGGPESVGITWVDVAGVRVVLEATLGPWLGIGPTADPEFGELGAWLQPLDRIVSVAHLEGDVLVQRTALLIE